MIGPSLTVDPDELAGVAASVRSAVEGVDLDELAGTLGGAEFGHDGLQGAVAGLAAAAQQAVASLRADASQLATGVTAAAAGHVDNDFDAGQMLVASAQGGAL
ncbi:MAG: hypothetical protein GEU98_17355 [Pseudonocardiaceae bacterium]|nr:hypothetical protein [Pseudonocardiaceae bacterium]